MGRIATLEYKKKQQKSCHHEIGNFGKISGEWRRCLIQGQGQKVSSLLWIEKKNDNSCHYHDGRGGMLMWSSSKQVQCVNFGIDGGVMEKSGSGGSCTGSSCNCSCSCSCSCSSFSWWGFEGDEDFQGDGRQDRSRHDNLAASGSSQASVALVTQWNSCGRSTRVQSHGYCATCRHVQHTRAAHTSEPRSGQERMLRMTSRGSSSKQPSSLAGSRARCSISHTNLASGAGLSWSTHAATTLMWQQVQASGHQDSACLVVKSSFIFFGLQIITITNNHNNIENYYN